MRTLKTTVSQFWSNIGKVVARHCRSFFPGKETTLREHMPPKYQHYFDSYDKEKILAKAKKLVPDVLAWAEII